MTLNMRRAALAAGLVAAAALAGSGTADATSRGHKHRWRPIWIVEPWPLYRPDTATGECGRYLRRFRASGDRFWLARYRTCLAVW